MGASAAVTPAEDRLLVPTVAVAEVFGPTFQGEGPSLGRRAAFVRLGGCNLHCSWCDTPYTWDASRYDLRQEITRRPVADVVDDVAEMHPSIIVVTGGEPLLWQRRPGWKPLLTGLAALAPVEIETNGTVPPDVDLRTPLPLRIARYNVSVKLAHAGDPEQLRINADALADFAALAGEGRAVLKIVCQTPEHVQEAAQLAHRHGFKPWQVWIMPEGVDPATLLRRHQELAPAALEYGFNMTTRLHILTWGDERGT